MMPEGPEVRSLVDRLHHRYSGGKWEIRSAKILSGRYLNSGEPPQGWEGLVSSLPLRVDSVRAKGKFIWFELSNGGGSDSNRDTSEVQLTAWSTLGLAGGWTLRPHRHARLAFHLVPLKNSQQRRGGSHHEASPPLSSSLSTSLASPALPRVGPQEVEEGEVLFYYDMRNFGTFRVCADASVLDAKLAKLGHSWLPAPYASTPKKAVKENADSDGKEERKKQTESGANTRHELTSQLTWPVFRDLVTASSSRYPHRPLAVFLMDQTKTSGIGNYILSEVLFETRTWPWASMGSVGAQRWRHLFDSVERVMGQSLAAQTTRTTAVEQNEKRKKRRCGDSSSSSSSSSGNAGGLARGGVRSLAPRGFTLMVYVERVMGQSLAAQTTRTTAVEHNEKKKETMIVSTTGEENTDSSSSSSDNAGGLARGGVRSLAPRGFTLMVYGRSHTPLCLVTEASEGGAAAAAAVEAAVAAGDSPGQQQQQQQLGCSFPVVRSEGSHKRSVHWVPSLQVGCKDGPDQGAPLDVARTAEEAALEAPPPFSSSPLSLGEEPSSEEAKSRPAASGASHTVAELKKQCAAMGLRVSGRKAELIARIAEANEARCTQQ
eukprot:CAMPEP_0171989112 /NCGR_PEP_ID=MMETSP0993-20121228/276248_1 /TAXON_ID=483369 /ORGANISM="non described non described, Strain CCMP2098" /LENGTH=601 /DNA_ID=CAMNT_0012642097 /DNA_START=88 /DNA_END=1893 /DNA_ORIENTATION=+